MVYIFWSCFRYLNYGMLSAANRKFLLPLRSVNAQIISCLLELAIFCLLHMLDPGEHREKWSVLRCDVVYVSLSLIHRCVIPFTALWNSPPWVHPCWTGEALRPPVSLHRCVDSQVQVKGLFFRELLWFLHILFFWLWKPQEYENLQNNTIILERSYRRWTLQFELKISAKFNLKENGPKIY